MNTLNDSPRITGKVTFKQTDKSGNVIFEKTVTNLVVGAGLDYIAARMVDDSIPSAMSHMALGASNTAATLLDTTLGAELGRVALSGGVGIVDSNTVTYTASFPAGTATGDIVEAGIFNNVTTGTMLCRTVFPLVTKGADDSLAVTWVITIN